MKKILLIDDSDTYTWCLQKYLQHRGYPVKTACTLKEARTAIQEEMPLVVCCDLDLPDGSGMDFLDEVRAADKELPFILASCHDRDDYEQEAKRRGATLCMDKMKGLLLQDKLVEYAYRQLSGEKAPTFHKLLFVHAEDTSAGVLQAAMLQKGFDLILVPSIGEAKRRIFEDKEIELILCDLKLPDGSGMDFLDEVRAADKELPFILASCHDKDDYEQEAMRRGATLCMDKMKGLLLQDKLVEYAYRQLSGEKVPTFHKLLFVYAEDTSAEVLRAAMLQKGFDLILVSSIWEAKRRIFEDKEIELILCDLELPDGTAMELFHTLRRVAGMFQMKNPPVRLLPFFILTENNDPATEYEYRHEGVNDYITAPVNIPELIRRVLFFVE